MKTAKTTAWRDKIDVLREVVARHQCCYVKLDADDPRRLAVIPFAAINPRVPYAGVEASLAKEEELLARGLRGWALLDAFSASGILAVYDAPSLSRDRREKFGGFHLPLMQEVAFKILNKIRGNP